MLKSFVCLSRSSIGVVHFIDGHLHSATYMTDFKTSRHTFISTYTLKSMTKFDILKDFNNEKYL